LGSEENSYMLSSSHLGNCSHH